MTITTEQINELRELAKPLQQWLFKNVHPHCQLDVTSTYLELVEGVAFIPSEGPAGVASNDLPIR